MGTKNDPGMFDCYDAAEPDEPMFVLLARDPDAADLVRLWAEKRERRDGSFTTKTVEARRCAEAMDVWRHVAQSEELATAVIPDNEPPARYQGEGDWSDGS